MAARSTLLSTFGRSGRLLLRRRVRRSPLDASSALAHLHRTQPTVTDPTAARIVVANALSAPRRSLFIVSSSVGQDMSALADPEPAPQLPVSFSRNASSASTLESMQLAHQTALGGSFSSLPPSAGPSPQIINPQSSMMSSYRSFVDGPGMHGAMPTTAPQIYTVRFLGTGACITLENLRLIMILSRLCTQGLAYTKWRSMA